MARARTSRASALAALLAALVIAAPVSAAEGPRPAVTGVSPDEGAAQGGSTVTITGSNFSEATAVKFEQEHGLFSSDAKSFTVDSDTEITAVTPPAYPRPGLADVVVVAPEGSSEINQGDRFGFGPVVERITPMDGPAAGGTPVTITGLGLAGASAVSFGPVPSSGFSENPDGSITAVSPPVSGDVTVAPVTVTTADGASEIPPVIPDTRAANYFDYGPTVTSISPAFGPPSGGTAVTIRGTGFEASRWQGNAGFIYGVEFGVAGCRLGVETFSPCERVEIEVLSDNELTAVSPAGNGTQDVVVVTAGGRSPIVQGDRFAYALADRGAAFRACAIGVRRHFRSAIRRAHKKYGKARAAALRRAAKRKRAALAACRKGAAARRS